MGWARVFLFSAILQTLAHDKYVVRATPLGSFDMFHLSRSLSASLHQRAPDDQDQQSDRRETRNSLASKSQYKRVDAPKKREAKKNRPQRCDDEHWS